MITVVDLREILLLAHPHLIDRDLGDLVAALEIDLFYFPEIASRLSISGSQFPAVIKDTTIAHCLWLLFRELRGQSLARKLYNINSRHLR